MNKSVEEMLREICDRQRAKWAVANGGRTPLGPSRPFRAGRRRRGRRRRL